MNPKDCTACEDWICGDPDGAGDVVPSIAAAHLAACPACRAFQKTWAALDAELVEQAALARLPEDFDATVFSKIPAPRARLTPDQIAARKAQAELSYHAALRDASFLGVLSDPTALLRAVAMIATCLSVGIVVAMATPLVAAAATSAWHWSSSGLAQGAAGILGMMAASFAAAAGGRSWLRRSTGR